MDQCRRVDWLFVKLLIYSPVAEDKVVLLHILSPKSVSDKSHDLDGRWPPSKYRETKVIEMRAYFVTNCGNKLRAKRPAHNSNESPLHCFSYARFSQMSVILIENKFSSAHVLDSHVPYI